MGSTTFRQNYANWGGAIFNAAVPSVFADEDERYVIPTMSYPEDTVFEDNYGWVSMYVWFRYVSPCSSSLASLATLQVTVVASHGIFGRS